jgi:hypothetical protein
MLGETQEFLVAYGAYFRDLTKAYLPTIIGSIAIVLFFWFLAFALRLILQRVLRGVDRVVEQRSGKPAVAKKHTASRIAGDVIFWFLVIFGLIFAAQNLGVPLLLRVLNYLPNILLAGIVFFIGYVLGNLFYKILQNSLAHFEVKRRHAIAQLAKWLTFIFFIVLGVEQLHLNITLLSNFTVIGFAAAVFCIALTFALSFTEILKNTLACQHVQKQLEIGRKVSIDEVQGKVIDFSQTHVLLETQDGIAHIPAHVFQQKAAKYLTAYK